MTAGTASYLRLKAAQCRRLARMILTPRDPAIPPLLALAAELEAKAAELEAEAKEKPRS